MAGMLPSLPSPTNPMQPVTAPAQSGATIPTQMPAEAGALTPQEIALMPQLLSLMQKIGGKQQVSNVDDPLAPVGVTPAQKTSSTDASKGGAKTDDLLSTILGNSGSKSNSSHKDVNLSDLLTGKASFSDTKAGKAIGAIESVGKIIGGLL